MNTNLEGKNALVCGSTQGIGKAAAIELALLGANVILMARNEMTLNDTVKILAMPYQQKHSYLRADFDDTQDVKQKITEFVKKNPVHILINNTGGPPGGTIADAKVEEFEKAFAQHLICNHILAQAVLPGMMRAAFGRIINVVSTSVKQPLYGLGVSNTIRGAVASWAKTMSYEVAKSGITVNNVLPGATATSRLHNIIENKAEKRSLETEEISSEMLAEIPAGRFGDPQEIAALIAFLATPAAAYITGQSIAVDGGRTMAF